MNRFPKYSRGFEQIPSNKFSTVRSSKPPVRTNFLIQWINHIPCGEDIAYEKYHVRYRVVCQIFEKALFELWNRNRTEPVSDDNELQCHTWTGMEQWIITIIGFHNFYALLSSTVFHHCTLVLLSSVLKLWTTNFFTNFSTSWTVLIC